MTSSGSTPGQMIRTARRAAGLSQAELARRLGTSRRHVIRWEHGICEPGRKYAAKLAETLGLALADAA